MTLQELFDMAAKGAAMLFATQGEVHPMLHGTGPTGAPIFIPLIWEDQREKTRVLKRLRMALPAFGVRQYAIISEAWIVECWAKDAQKALDRLARFETLADHPDRREALTVTAADKDGNVIGGYFYILRPEHGPPKLSPLHNDDVRETLGDFTDLLL